MNPLYKIELELKHNRQRSPVLIKGNGLSIRGEDMKVEGLDGVTGVVVKVGNELVQEETSDPLFSVCLAHAK